MRIVPAPQRESYTSIIDSILAASDLNTISAKRIRKGLQEQVPHDLTPQKAAITALIMERFDKVQTAAKASTTAAKRKSPALEDSPAPKKKVKKSKPEETDEQIAARLQAEFDTQTNSRATRGGGRTKKAPLKKGSVVKKKKKSSAKVTGEDDSDLEGASGSEKPEPKRNGGFHVRCGGLVSFGSSLTCSSETHEPLTSSGRHAGRNTALSTTDCQKDLGIRQGARSTESRGQTDDLLRRCDAKGVQGG